MGLWIQNVSTCFGRMKLNIAFLKAVYDGRHAFNINVKFVPFSYDIGKERILKMFCPAVERLDICVISSIKKTNNRRN